MKDCRGWRAEIVEQARRSATAGKELGGHLAVCPRCAARWEAERELSRRLGQVRDALPPAGDAAGRDLILARFASQRRRAALRARMPWALAAAASLFVAAVLLNPRQPSGALDGPAETELAEVDEFVDVPYAPPLASGELLSVVQVELPPGALIRMGFPVEAAYGAEVAADVLVGEDNLPRAVRLRAAQDTQP